MISGSYVMCQKYVNKVCAANLGFPRNLKAGPCAFLMLFSNEKRLAVPNAGVVELGKELNIPLEMTESTFQVSITWS